MSHMGAITFRNASIVRGKILKHAQKGKGKPLAVICDQSGIFCKYLLPLFFQKRIATLCCFQGSSTSKFPVFGNVHIRFNDQSLRACLGSVFLAGARLAVQTGRRPVPAYLDKSCGTRAMWSEGLFMESRRHLSLLRPGLKAQLYCLNCVTLRKVDFPSSSAVS